MNKIIFAKPGQVIRTQLNCDNDATLASIKQTEVNILTEIKAQQAAYNDLSLCLVLGLSIITILLTVIILKLSK